MKFFIKTLALCTFAIGTVHPIIAPQQDDFKQPLVQPQPDPRGFEQRAPNHVEILIADAVNRTTASMGRDYYPNAKKRALNKCGTELIAQKRVATRYNLTLEVVQAACKAAR